MKRLAAAAWTAAHVLALLVLGALIAYLGARGILAVLA